MRKTNRATATPIVKPVLALAWYEDMLACASFVEASGFHEDAARLRETAAKLKPVTTSRRWADRAVAS